MRRKKLRAVNLINPGKFEEIQKNLGGFGEIVPKNEQNLIKKQTPHIYEQEKLRAINLKYLSSQFFCLVY